MGKLYSANEHIKEGWNASLDELKKKIPTAVKCNISNVEMIEKIEALYEKNRINR